MRSVCGNSFLRTTAETSAVSLQRTTNYRLNAQRGVANSYVRSTLVPPSSPVLRMKRAVRQWLARVRATDCDHRNIHKPLACLEKCWDCGSMRTPGGSWIPEVR